MTVKSNRRNRIREGSRTATVLLYALAILIGLITLYPMYYVLILSVSDPSAAMTMRVYTVPKGFSLSSYALLVRDSSMWRAYANTILYILPTTLIMLATCVMAAFPLTVKGLRFRRFINTYLLIPMYFSGGMIPSFLLIVKLGLYDHPLSQILPACFSIWNIILTKAYLSSIPEALREAARIDGANAYQTLLQVYLPMSKPILAVIAVYTIVGVWNSWFNAMVYLPHTTWQPLQLYLRRVLVENTADLTRTLSADEALSEVPYLLLSDRLFDRFGAGKLMCVSALALTLRWLLVATAKSVPVLMLSQVLHGWGFIVMTVSMAKHITRNVPKELQASGQMLLAVVSFGLARAFGNLGGGLLAHAFGQQNVFYLTSAVCALAFLIFAPQFLKKKA